MATGADVLSMLIPQGGWAINGNDFDGVTFLDCAPITKSQFEAGFAQFDSWKLEQDAKSKSDKAAAQSKLEALGLTSDDLKALGL